MDGKIEIFRSDRVTGSDNLTRLFSELSGFHREPDIDRINSLIADGTLAFYLVCEDDRPVGMASVISCRTAASDKLWIEDVCILSECRGRGLGRALLEFAIKDSVSLFGEGTFWLTSRPSRTVARKMYEALGFSEYETGVYRL